MKSFAKLAVAGISGVVLFKLFATILFPLLGLMLGLLALTVKLALLAAVAFFIWGLVKKRNGDVEVDVEVGDVQDLEEEEEE